MSLQWCFTGNSGMGKRAMARIIARLYKAMGLVEKEVAGRILPGHGGWLDRFDAMILSAPYVLVYLILVK